MEINKQYLETGAIRNWDQTPRVYCQLSFRLDPPLGLLPSSLESCRNLLFDMCDRAEFLSSIPNRADDLPMFVNKNMGKPKSQHSALRGGPPSSWTLAVLTEALQQVKITNMTTSEASRRLRNPHNLLLMHMRRKYSKGFKKVENCIGVNLSKNNDRDRNFLQNTRPTYQYEPPPRPTRVRPFSNFYPHFSTGFPFPVSMLHLLPKSSKNKRAEHDPYGQTASHEDVEMKSDLVKEMDEECGQQDLNSDDRQELVQQNSQDE